MTYSQFREEIENAAHIADGRTCLSRDGGLCPCQIKAVMTAIDTYLEEKAAEVVGSQSHTDVHPSGLRNQTEDEFRISKNEGLQEAAAFIRSKE